MSGRTVLVTGARGFVGRHACRQLRDHGWDVVGAVRDAPSRADLPEGTRPVVVAAPTHADDWETVLAGVDAVLHLAGRAHTGYRGPAARAAYRRDNVEVTTALASAARRSDVRRIVYASSVKAFGDGHSTLSETTPATPSDAYGRTKLAAEHALHEAAANARFDCVALRPPLMYGPGVKGNFLKLLRAVARGAPLPFGRARARRSFLFVGSFVDAVRTVLEAPTVPGPTFVVADRESFSTAELIRTLAELLHTRARLVGLPPTLLRWVLTAMGRRDTFERLFGTLVVDSSAFERAYAWTPPFSARDGLTQTVHWFRSSDR